MVLQSITFFRLNERKIQLKTIGYAASMMGGGSGANGVLDAFGGLGSPPGSTSSFGETRLSADLSDINLNNDAPMESAARVEDDIFSPAF